MNDILTHLLFYSIGLIIGNYLSDKVWHKAVTEAIEEFIEEVLDGKE